MSLSRHIALVFEPTSAYARGILRGIYQFARPDHAWTCHRVKLGGAKPSLQPARSFDSVIAHNSQPSLWRSIRRMGIPSVSVVADPICVEHASATVAIDDDALGVLAAEHFAERSFHEAAYVGWQGFGFSERRGDAFVERARQKGMTVERFDVEARSLGVDGPLDPVGYARDLQSFLSARARPLAVFACNDKRALDVCEACFDLGLSIPKDVAVLGVDDDPFFCQMHPSTLSSIRLPTTEIGRLAAETLHHVMVGNPPTERVHLLPPAGIALRHSTDVVAGDDPLLQLAVSFIQEHLTHGINIDDVAAHVGVSRRTLEYHFQKGLGTTPHRELQRMRLDRAKRLLETTVDPIAYIARASGFQSPERFATAFRQACGLTPSAYRLQAREHAS